MDDEPEDVLENRRRLCAAVGLPLERLVVPGQVHGTTLAWVGEAEAGRGALDSQTVIREHDGLLTGAAGLGLAISYADCVPVVDRRPTGTRGRRSRRCTPAGAGCSPASSARRRRELCRGRRLVAAVVGPSIGPCCFTVDDELRRRFEARFPGSAGAATVDLWRCARLELEAAGVPPAAVAVAGLCTATRRALLLAPPRPRRDRAASGDRLAAGSVGRPQK